tara:strand:- start:186 stop:329 length:144 start_codon:yes stop_codon:yes gene_type:complete
MEYTYFSLMQDYYISRIDGMSRHIKKLKTEIKSLREQIEINQRTYYE